MARAFKTAEIAGDAPRRVSVRQRPEWEGFDVMVGDDNLADVTQKVTTVLAVGQIPRVVIETGPFLTDAEMPAARVALVPGDLVRWAADLLGWAGNACPDELRERGEAIARRYGDG